LTAEIKEESAIGADHQLPPYVPPRHTGLWVAFWCLLILAVAFFLVRHREEAKKAAADAHRPTPGVSITTVTAQKGDIGVYLEAIGTVTPVYTDSITSEVNGLVTAVHFTEGQRVHKGEPLIDIDSRPYRATLLQAQGALERDQNVLAQAQMDFDRYRAAWARNAIAKQQMEDQEKIVHQDEGTVKNDRGTVQFDQVQVGFCSIAAPISGRVGFRLVDPGNYVQASGTTTLAVITQMEPITVILTLPEDSLGQVVPRLNRGAKLAVDAFDRTAQTKLASGVLLTLDNQIDTTTGTVKGRAIFANKDDALFPNQFVNTRLLVNTLRGVTLVPSSALQQNGQASFVYVIQNNYAHQRSVTPGVTNGGLTQVDGVNPGEILADSSFDKLQDNVKVAVSNKPAGSGKPGADNGPGKSGAHNKAGKSNSSHSRGSSTP
jgi:multidrug efflux system membrane fusion protein